MDLWQELDALQTASNHTCLRMIAILICAVNNLAHGR